MNKEEKLNSLLQNMLLGLKKLETRNELQFLDISQCHELNKEITSKMTFIR
jgi:hypothetical protein